MMGLGPAPVVDGMPPHCLGIATGKIRMDSGFKYPRPQHKPRAGARYPPWAWSHARARYPHVVYANGFAHKSAKA